MHVPLLVLVVVLGTTLASCGTPLSLAVQNRDGVPYLLRVVDGQHRAWRVPPKASGRGLTGEGTDTRFVIISTPDCTEIGRFGISAGEHTLIVEGGTMANPDMRDSIDAGLGPLEQIADPCP